MIGAQSLANAGFTASDALAQSKWLTKMLGGTSVADAVGLSAANLVGWSSPIVGHNVISAAASSPIHDAIAPTNRMLGEIIATSVQPAIDAWKRTVDHIGAASSIHEAISAAAAQHPMDAWKHTADRIGATASINEAISAGAAQPAIEAWNRLAPTFDIDQFMPKLDWSRFAPTIDIASRFDTRTMVGAIPAQTIWERLERARRARERELSPDSLPSNLRTAASTPEGREHLEQVLLIDGLPLAYALSEEAVGRVLAEDTASKRLERMWSRRAGILATCEERLLHIRADHLHHAADLARQALRAFRADLHGPAQAQAITIIDTHFTMDAPLELEKLVTGVRTPHRKLRRLAERAFAVHAPIAAIFSRDFNGQGHKHGRKREVEPRNLSRQATIHGAGRRQYTKRNALLSIAMVTSLICLLEDEHSRAAFSRP